MLKTLGFNKYILYNLIIIMSMSFFFLSVKDISANVPVVSGSAKLNTGINSKIDLREIRLSNFLSKYNSPLQIYAKDFIFYSDKYFIDWRLVPAISGVESTFGKNIPFDSYNAYGWNNGNYYFSSWEESIMIVNKTLREKYYDKGKDNLSLIAGTYAPPSGTWKWNVKYFLNKIDPIPVVFDI